MLISTELEILDIGSCFLHILHGAFKTDFEMYDEIQNPS